MDKALNIWISRTDKIGDMMVSIPCFYALRQMYPTAKITVLANSYNAGMLKNLACINQILYIDQIPFQELVDLGKKEKISIFVALFTSKIVAKLVKKIKPLRSIGNYSKWYSFLAYNDGLIQKRSTSLMHESYYNLELVRHINPALFDKVFEYQNQIFLDSSCRNKADLFFKNQNIHPNPIIIHPFNGGSAANLTLENYTQLIQKIRQLTPKDFVLLGTKKEEIQLKQIKTQAQISGIYLYYEAENILDLAAIIARAGIYIGSSTGPTHIANSFKLPIIAFFPQQPLCLSIHRWGLLANKNANYIFPDSDIKGKNLFFDHYNAKIEAEILEKIALFI